MIRALERNGCIVSFDVEVACKTLDHLRARATSKTAALEALNELVQSGERVDVRREILFGREEDRIEHLGERIQLVMLKLHRRSRQQQNGATRRFRLADQVGDEVVHVGSVDAVAVSLRAGVMRLVDYH